MKPEYLTLDTRSDRKEIHGLLARLPPEKRVAFLQWACRQVPKTNDNKLPEPAVWKMWATADLARRCDRADLALTNEVYADVMTLSMTWNLDLVKCVLVLEQLVRRLRV
jgi:hypothetical protein